MTNIRQYADVRQTPPATINYEMQPYGALVLGQLTWGQYNGFPTLSGVVVEGAETARLFQHATSRSVIGERRTIYAIEQHEIDSGKAIRIAM